MPPRPAHFKTARPGCCKFCGDPIFKKDGVINKRASWHPQCALKWTIMNNPRDARRFVFLRDRGICQAEGCGKNCAPNGGHPDATRRIIEQIMSPRPTLAAVGALDLPLGTWELDHVIPLSQARRLGNPPELWQLGNMTTLCPACHKAKTAADRLLYRDDAAA